MEHPRVVEFDRCMAIHLAIGDCLLCGWDRGCFCGLTRRDGTEDLALAEKMWRLHRDEVLQEAGSETPWAEEKFGK